MSYTLLIAVVLVVLFVWWKMMSFTFGLIERAHAELRDEAGEEPFPGANPW